MSDAVELEYVEEIGPGIVELPSDVQFGGTPAPEGPEPVQVLPGWEEKTVEQFLMGGGAGVHMLIGQGEKDWLMTEKDLERIVPPMTRIMNRWEPALRLSPYADPLLVAHGFALYGWRSALERARALKDKAEDERPAPARAAYVQDGFKEPEEDGFAEMQFTATEPYFEQGAKPRSGQ